MRWLRLEKRTEPTDENDNFAAICETAGEFCNHGEDESEKLSNFMGKNKKFLEKPPKFLDPLFNLF